MTGKITMELEEYETLTDKACIAGKYCQLRHGFLEYAFDVFAFEKHKESRHNPSDFHYPFWYAKDYLLKAGITLEEMDDFIRCKETEEKTK